MEAWNRPRTWIVLAAVVLGGWLLYELWHWEVERVEVPPGHFVVRTHLWGEDLPPDRILAPDENHQGIQKETLPEGRHWLNPLVWTYEVHKMLEVPIGKCAILTRTHGKELPAERVRSGDFLVSKDDSDDDKTERGIVREPLLPGKYRINPYAYKVDLVDAVQIGVGEVGVHTLKVGRDPRELKGPRPSPYVVPEGYRGVQEKPLSAGTYYINPFAEAIVAVQVRSRRVEFTDISFPSRDGFTLKPHVLVTYRVLPEKAPELFVMLTREGRLHQEDATLAQQEENEVLQKVVLPFMRGYVRIEGSNYAARDFMSLKAGPAAPGDTNPRERLQRDLMEKVVPLCQKLGLEIESITLAQMTGSNELKELAKQIAQRELARVTREKNQDLVSQYKSEQTLKAKETLKDQQAQKVAAQQALEVARTEAQQRKEVEQAKLEQDLTNAQTRLEAAKSKAKEVLANAKAEAGVITAQNEAEVAGLRKAVQGFPSPEHFAQYHMLAKLAPALTEIFASDNGDIAKLFSTYMAQPQSRDVKSVAGVPAKPEK